MLILSQVWNAGHEECMPLTASLQLRHDGFIRPTPTSNGTIPVLLLQPRPKARQQATWPLLPTPKCPGPSLSPAGAASALDPNLLQADFFQLAATNVNAGVQHVFPVIHDTNGLSKAHVSKANHPDPGARSETNVRCGRHGYRYVLLPINPSSFIFRKQRE